MSVESGAATIAPSMLWRAAPRDTLLIEPLDALAAVFHRGSGITHLLAEPAPEILAALAEAPLTTEALLDRLTQAFDLADAGRDALADRLDELAAVGLVERVPAPRR